MRSVYILAAALVIAFIAFLGIKITRIISREGFETMKNLNDLLALQTDKISTVCPNNGVLIGRVTLAKNIDKESLSKFMTNPSSLLETGSMEITWLCYPPGISNVNPFFQTDPNNPPSGVMVIGPKGYTIELYSDKDAKGTPIKTINDLSSSNIKECVDQVCSDYSKDFMYLKFSSVKITPPTAVAAATTAATTSVVTNTPLMNSISNANFGSATGSTLTSDSNQNMVSVTCPLGDKPKISFVRNTKNAIPGLSTSTNCNRSECSSRSACC
jgi:hypothetical protein